MIVIAVIQVMGSALELQQTYASFVQATNTQIVFLNAKTVIARARFALGNCR